MTHSKGNIFLQPECSCWQLRLPMIVPSCIRLEQRFCNCPGQIGWLQTRHSSTRELLLASGLRCVRCICGSASSQSENCSVHSAARKLIAFRVCVNGVSGASRSDLDNYCSAAQGYYSSEQSLEDVAANMSIRVDDICYPWNGSCRSWLTSGIVNRNSVRILVPPVSDRQIYQDQPLKVHLKVPLPVRESHEKYSQAANCMPQSDPPTRELFCAHHSTKVTTNQPVYCPVTNVSFSIVFSIPHAKSCTRNNCQMGR